MQSVKDCGRTNLNAPASKGSSMTSKMRRDLSRGEPSPDHLPVVRLGGGSRRPCRGQTEVHNSFQKNS